MTCGEPSWALLLDCAQSLTERGDTPFTRKQLISCVQASHADRGRSSLDPTIQGMTSNASGGPRPACGEVFVRVSRGQYALADEDLTDRSRVGTPARPVAPNEPRGDRDRSEATATGSVDQRLRELEAGFEHFVQTYDSQVPFQRRGQYQLHRRTIDRRIALGTVEAALADDDFVSLLRQTLRAWGLGKRASHLAELKRFGHAIRARTADLMRLDQLHIQDQDLDVDYAVDKVWTLIARMDITDNVARIVAGSKTLHHLLPDLVVPMDRAWTGAFFDWSPANVQNRQRRTFTAAYRAFIDLAQKAQPSQYVGDGWRTSPTKVVDNAVIGYCKEHALG